MRLLLSSLGFRWPHQLVYSCVPCFLGMGVSLLAPPLAPASAVATDWPLSLPRAPASLGDSSPSPWSGPFSARQGLAGIVASVPLSPALIACALRSLSGVGVRFHRVVLQRLGCQRPVLSSSLYPILGYLSRVFFNFFRGCFAPPPRLGLRPFDSILSHNGTVVNQKFSSRRDQFYPALSGGRPALSRA